MSNKIESNVDFWLSRTNNHQRSALENASRYFDDNDAFTVNSLEAIYGQESSFGAKLGKRGSSGAVGHFQIEAVTAVEYGAKVSNQNDERFDIDSSSILAAKYIRSLNNIFSKKRPIIDTFSSIPIPDLNQRKFFVIAAYNAGEGRIVKAQAAAKEDGKNPQKWDDVKQYLVKAGATEQKAEEITDYVEKVTKYEEEFSKKSPSNKNAKNEDPLKLQGLENEDGHWITKKGHHIVIKDKNV
jgi:membrane-bound lytic murein transglycosylase MltF